MLEYLVCAVLAGIAAPFFETIRVADFVAGAVPLLYAGVISGAIAFTMQIVAQRYTPPAEAAIILSLESVFAAIAGAILLSERLTDAATLGCALILSSALLVEIGGPLWGWLRNAAARRSARPPGWTAAPPR